MLFKGFEANMLSISMVSMVCALCDHSVLFSMVCALCDHSVLVSMVCALCDHSVLVFNGLCLVRPFCTHKPLKYKSTLAISMVCRCSRCDCAAGC